MTDGRTDRRTDTLRWQRPRCAERRAGKNGIEKVPYRKQIARQHSCHENFRPWQWAWSTLYYFPLILSAKLGCCFSYSMRACRRSQKVGDAGAVELRSLWLAAWLIPKTRLSPASVTMLRKRYHAEFGRSMLGLQKLCDAGDPPLSMRGVADP